MAESLTYLCQKISKVRWVPTTSTLQKSEKFATGSYEDTKNCVAIWGISHMTQAANPDWFEVAQLKSSQPQKVCQCSTSGDIQGMEFADSETLAVGLSTGDVVLMKLDSKEQQLNIDCEWRALHKFGGSTDVAVEFPELTSVGEDGSIHVLRTDRKAPLRTFAYADSCPITCVKYVSSHEICTTNTMGQLRIWDLRSPNDRPTRVIVSCDTLTALRSVDKHPSQNHVIATGSADGSVTLHDVRKDNGAVTKLQVHSEDVWEVRFHKSLPSNVFTCSEDGCARRLNCAFEMKALAFGSAQVEVAEFLTDCGSPVNSVDVNGSRMVCSTDAESVYIVDDVA